MLSSRFRRWAINRIEKETKWIAYLQSSRFRNQWLDTLFHVAGLSGTHVFYMVVLPWFFWFQTGILFEPIEGKQDDVLRVYGRGIVVLLASGCYFTGVIKDMLSLPRPHKKVMLLVEHPSTIKEFGLPSTHAAHSFGLATYSVLFYRSFLVNNHHLSTTLSSNHPSLSAIAIPFFTYAVLVSFSRIYTGVHSILDVAAGTIVGISLGVLTWFGTFYYWEHLIISCQVKYLVYFCLASLGLILIFCHPHPMTFCPCYDDSVAFISVVVGVFLGNMRYEPTKSVAAFRATTSLSQALTIAIYKLSSGVFVVLLWRVVAKKIIYWILSNLNHHLFKHAQQKPKSAEYRLPKYTTSNYTKIIVYFGIGWIATELVPRLHQIGIKLFFEKELS